MLKDKVIFVTGASKGIGKAIARLCVNCGANVWVNGRNELLLNEVASEIGAQALCYDVTDQQATKAAFNRIRSESGQLDGLVNNAGIMLDFPLMMTRIGDFEQTLQTNLLAPFHHIQLAARLMIKQKSGAIVNLCSVVGEEGSAGQSAYSSSKAGLSGLTKSAAKELAPLGIRVNGVAPGFIDTDLIAHYDENHKAQVTTNIALNRAGQVNEVAEQICFLLSDKASYTTGQIIKVDGAMSL